MSFVPKLNKVLKIKNLRPISLTWCLGKAMEHVMLASLQRHMEDNGLLPPQTGGFRTSLAVQDAMLCLHHDS